MIRFHNGSNITLDVYSNKSLIIANILPKQTSLYVKVSANALFGSDSDSRSKSDGDCDYATVLKGVSGSTKIFIAKMKIKNDKKYTVYLSSLNVKVYKDSYCPPKNGSALVRDLRVRNSWYEILPGPTTINGVSFDAINKGVYTIFEGVAVLYNCPEDMIQDLCFQRYIGKWNVVKSFGVQKEKFYIFSETTEGKWETVNAVTTPFTWIVHETDYDTYSLNGSANRQRLAILARCNLTPCKYKELISLAKCLGYDTDKLQ